VDDEVQRRDTFRTNDSGSEDDDTTNVHTPVKRAKIPLNQPFSPNSFKVFPVVNDQGTSEKHNSNNGYKLFSSEVYIFLLIVYYLCC
jgi:hypothetical protein